MLSRGLWAIILSFAALHLVMGWAIPLVDDEAYYQFWATNPSLGYYDHPPMVAWWIALGQKLLGETALGVRFLSIIAGSVLTLLVYRITWVFTEHHRASLMAALWSNAMVPFAALGFVATPDAPSVLFWVAGFWALAELEDQGKGHWWLLVGLFAGLGVQAKFTNLFFGVGLVVWLLGSSNGRKWLFSWQLWLGGLVAVAVMAPQAYWNHQNDWIGLELQFGRIGARTVMQTDFVIRLLVSTALLISPLIFWMMVKGMIWGRPRSLLVWINAPLVLFLVYHSLTSPVSGNWMLPVFPLMAVLAALPLAQRPGRWISHLAAPTSIGLAAVIMTLGMWPGAPYFPGKQVSFNQTKGWDGMIGDISAMVTQSGAKWIATDSYGLASQMHSHLGKTLPVWALNDINRYGFRGRFPSELCDEPALFVSSSDYADGTGAGITKTGPAQPIIRRSAGVEVEPYFGFPARGVTASFAGCN